MNEITLRKGKIDDLEALKKLFYETVTTVCINDYSPEQIKVWASGIKNQERWIDILTNQYVIIAESGSKIVGFATLDGVDYLDMLYIHKDFQGLGIAKMLFENIENEAKNLGASILKSDVSKTALKFFQKMDFQLISEQIVVRKGVELTNFKMQKNLEQFS